MQYFKNTLLIFLISFFMGITSAHAFSFNFGDDGPSTSNSYSSEGLAKSFVPDGDSEDPQTTDIAVTIDFGADGAAGTDAVTHTDGAKGTVTYDGASKTFTYTWDGSSEGGDSFSYTVTDGDGDQVTRSVFLDIDGDSTPAVTATTPETVDEDDLSAGIGDAAAGDDNAVTTGSINFDTGIDNLSKVELSTSTTGLTADGAAVTFVWDAGAGAAGAGALIGYTGAVPASVGDAGVVVYVELHDTAALIGSSGADSVGYNVVLVAPLDHLPGADTRPGALRSLSRHQATPPLGERAGRTV